MHYRNGREAKNGDTVVQLESTTGKALAVGQLRNAIPGNDHCNDQIVVTGGADYGPAVVVGACLCDCIHVDDLAAILSGLTNDGIKVIGGNQGDSLSIAEYPWSRVVAVRRG